MALTDNQYASAVIKAFGDLGDQWVIIMTAVGMAESQSSGGDTAQSPGFQRGGVGAAGAFQIQNNHSESELGIPGFWSQGLWKNADTNASAARKIYNSQGITAWSAYTNKAYSQYLPRAQAAVAAVKKAGPVASGSGTEAGAQAWFLTQFPGNQLPAEWHKAGNFGGNEATHIAKSADGVYMFTGTTKQDGSGSGNLSWNADNKSNMYYVSWDKNGIASVPRKADAGEVTPVDPFGLNELFSMGQLGPYLWIAGGALLVVLGVVLLAKDVTPVGKIASIASKVAA